MFGSRILPLAAVLLAACRVHGPALSQVAAEPAAVPQEGGVIPVLQVRGDSRSSAFEVVAWDSLDADVGLRTAINRNGELVGGLRYGDHRLYVTAGLSTKLGGFKYASAGGVELLRATGMERDAYSCFFGPTCSPSLIAAVRVPDALLRANRDSLVVTFFPDQTEPWAVVLPQKLIRAYLQKVDEVSDSMRRGAK